MWRMGGIRESLEAEVGFRREGQQAEEGIRESLEAEVVCRREGKHVEEGKNKGEF